MGRTNLDELYVTGPVYSQGSPLVPYTTGTTRYVSSTHANKSDNNSGIDANQPIATVDAAIGKCTASVGDVIILMPGHAETVTATSIALDVAGVTIVGLGYGLNRPVFTFGAAAATITVSAANCTWKGCDFLANFLDVASAFTIGAAKDFRLENNTFRCTDATKDFLSIVTTGATANAADGLTFKGNYQFSLDVTTLATVSVLGNLNRLEIDNNFIDKACTNDAGQLLTVADKVILGARVSHNKLNIVGSTAAAVGLLITGSSTTNTGMVWNNYVTSLDTTGALLVTAAIGLAVQQNYVSGVVAASGLLWPSADTPS